MQILQEFKTSELMALMYFTGQHSTMASHIYRCTQASWTVFKTSGRFRTGSGKCTTIGYSICLIYATQSPRATRHFGILGANHQQLGFWVSYLSSLGGTLYQCLCLKWIFLQHRFVLSRLNMTIYQNIPNIHVLWSWCADTTCLAVLLGSISKCYIHYVMEGSRLCSFPFPCILFVTCHFGSF